MWNCAESGTRFAWPVPPYIASNHRNDVDAALPELDGLLDSFPQRDEPRYLLEVGCGSGSRLAVAAKRGWKCFGVEPDDALRARAEEHGADFAQVVTDVDELIPHAFDLILLLDALEQVADPYSWLFRLFNAGCIGPETRLVITTIDGDSEEAAIIDRLGGRSPTVDLVHHTPRSLRRWLSAVLFERIEIQPIRRVDEVPRLLCNASGSRFYAFMLERYVPGTWSKLAEYEHVPRYQFARRLARGARVLDFGCGTGYGSRALADVADDVVGLDIDEDALSWARLWHDRTRLRFERHDDLGATLPSASFDLITCFEMIEHVDHDTQRATITSLARLLTPTGRLVISTPNPAVTANYGDNPYHLREMNEQEFMALLTPHFAHVSMSRQWVRPSILIGDEAIPSGSVVTTARLGTDAIVEEPPAFIAVCAQQPIERIDPFVAFDDSFDMVLARIRTQKTVTGLRFDNYLLREARDQAVRQVAQAVVEARSSAEADRLHAEALAGQVATIDTMRAAFDEQALSIVTLRTELTTREEALRAQASTIATMRGDFDAQQANIEELRVELASKAEAFEVQETTIATMRRDFDVQQTSIETLRSEVASKELALQVQATTIAAMRSAFETQEAHIERLRSEACSKDETLMTQATVIAALQRGDETQRATIERQILDAGEARERLAAREIDSAQLAARLQQAEEANAQNIARTVSLEALVVQRTAEKDDWQRHYRALEHTRTVRLVRLLRGTSGSRAPMLEACYLIAGGMIPGRVKARLGPIAAHLRDRFSQKTISEGGFAPYQVKAPTTVRAARPRVLHVIANFMTGGSSRLVVDLLEHMGGDYEQHVLTSFIPSPPNYIGVEIGEVRQPSDVAAMRNYVDDFDPQLVHVHYWGDIDEPWYRAAIGVASERGCPIIQNVNTPVAPFVSPAIRRTVFVSRYVLEHFGDGEPHNAVIYPGSDFALFAAGSRSRRAVNCIGMVYRLERDKLDETAIEPFIEAAHGRPGLKCLIVGGGSLLEPFQARVHAEGLDDAFEFTGYVSYKDLPALYRRMDVFVAPIWKESFGQVSAFAMNMGIPVIGYDVGAIPEIVADPSLLAPSRDAKALAAIAVKLVRDDRARASIGLANRERASRMFSVEAMIDAYRTLYQDLVQR